MKKIRLISYLLIIFVVSSCKKVANNAPTRMTTDEAADMVSGSLAINSNGAVGVSTDLALSANVAVAARVACGTTRMDSVSRSNTQGAVTYSYKGKSTFTLNCNSNSLPDNLTAIVSFAGFYSGPNLYFNHNGTSNFTMAGLSPTAPAYVISGEDKGSGQFKSKIDTTNYGTYNGDYIISKLTLLKTTHLPVSGSGSFSLTATVPKKGSFTFTGTILFNNDATATVTINSSVYSINLLTGQRTKK